jgi:DNA-binding NtrC family response regulator/tetratricopeptide (TPR) repeat protein
MGSDHAVAQGARPPEQLIQHARALLIQGRSFQALAVLRRVRRRPLTAPSAFVALLEIDALTGIGRHWEALGIASRALERRPLASDHAVRLRLARGRALWRLGRTTQGLKEVRRAQRGAEEALTKARSLETLAFMLWKDQEHEEALALLVDARSTYEQHGNCAGLMRVWETEAELLRDQGRLEEALALVERWIAAAIEQQRVAQEACARVECGALLAGLGRWAAARAELARAEELFRSVQDPRALTLVGVTRASIDLSTAQLAPAREALDRLLAREVHLERRPRTLVEVLCVDSDYHLLKGDLGASEEAASRAIAVAVAAKDRTGECWGRIRRSQALLAAGRASEAAREARRTVARVAPQQAHMSAWARLALGRTLLHVRRQDAAPVFAEAERCAANRPILAATARLGCAAALGVSQDEPAVRRDIQAVEDSGDRQLLSFLFDELRRLFGGVPLPSAASDQEVRARSLSAVPASDFGPEMLKVALVLAGDGDGRTRWVEAMKAVRTFLPWNRAVLLGTIDWELSDELRLMRGGADSLAREVARQTAAPGFVRLDRHPEFYHHPARAMRDITIAVVAAPAAGVQLYFDFCCEVCLTERLVAVVDGLGRLIGQLWDPSGGDDGPPQGHSGILGQSPGMLVALEDVRRFAPSDTPVYICGETGTGKERIARAIHEHSLRRGGPFVAVNASSLSDERFESELGGHARGAYTGADTAREGFLAEAEGGTLFIDEVADLSLRAQAKLLRMVENREYYRLGETKLRRANVRFVSASNADLSARVASGAFRPDLKFRLDVARVWLPPLRERGDDILLLARHLLSTAAARYKRQPARLSAEAAHDLCRYSWPGNVRQLQNEMERLALLPLQCVRREHLSQEIRSSEALASRPLSDARLEFERNFIQQTLAAHGGNRARAAFALGLSRQGLGAKIRQIGLA